MVCGTKLRIYKTIFTRIQPNSLFLIALKNKKHFDIIICGGGAAGLLLAHGLIQNNAFDHLSIVLIEKEEEKLKFDEKYIEKIAREKFKMVKPGERVFKITD